MKHLFVIALGVMTIVTACHSTKKIQTNPVPTTVDTVKVDTKPVVVDSAAFKASVLDKIESNRIDFTWFSSKVKVDYKDSKGKNIDANAFIRIKKDSVIWASLTGALGIEGYRVMVTPDTVILMNKLDKNVEYKSVAYLQELIKLPVDFQTLQDLLIGNPIFVNDTIVSLKSDGNSLLVDFVGNYFKNELTIDTASSRILRSKLDDVDPEKSRTCEIVLGGFNESNGKLFSEERNITVTEKNKLEIKLDFKQVVFDEPQSFPFSIPKSYKVK